MLPAEGTELHLAGNRLACCHVGETVLPGGAEKGPFLLETDCR